MGGKTDTELKVLRRLVSRIPKTRDGHPAIPTVDYVWSVVNLGRGVWQALDELARDAPTVEASWSSREAAEQQARKEGKRLNAPPENVD